MGAIMTLIFWCIAWAITLLVLGLLLWPLLKRQESLKEGEGEKTLSVYRQQFSELEQDLKNAVLTDEQYQQSKRELERRLFDETGLTEAAVPERLWQGGQASSCFGTGDHHSDRQRAAILGMGQPAGNYPSQRILTSRARRAGLHPTSVRRARRAFRAVEEAA